ncbi:MAG: GNAT family N-acetyltransferase [Cyanobacteria bacterium]|nr:GNAT family N-acetyltransferase [Cyanobacteriota bacterium]
MTNPVSSLSPFTTVAIELLHLDKTSMDWWADLVHEYRQSLGLASNIHEVRHFVFTRMTLEDSLVYIAADEQEPMGFIQLYPSFSTAQLESMWYLHDIYVRPTHRQKGVAKLLLARAIDFARERGDCAICIPVQPNNQEAISLCQAAGFHIDSTMTHYSLSLI